MGTKKGVTAKCEKFACRKIWISSKSLIALSSIARTLAKLKEKTSEQEVLRQFPARNVAESRRGGVEKNRNVIESGIGQSW